MTLVGVDVYIWSKEMPKLPERVGPFALELISNRGTRVYPTPLPDLEVIDWWRCRFLADQKVTHADVQALLDTLSRTHIWTKVQKLFEIDGVAAYSAPY